jgi:hypothetical protein
MDERKTVIVAVESTDPDIQYVYERPAAVRPTEQSEPTESMGTETTPADDDESPEVEPGGETSGTPAQSN